MQAAVQGRPSEGFPRGIARGDTSLGSAGGDILIYKSIVVLSGIALPLIAAVNWFVRGVIAWPQLSLTSCLLAIALLCWGVSHRGRRDIAAALLIGLLWTAATIYAFQSGFGMHSAVIFLYLPCVLYTALFFGMAIASVELVLTVAALLLMYVAEGSGRLGGAALYAAQGTNFNFLTGVILTSVGTLIVSLVYHRRIERETAGIAAEAERRRLAMEQAQLAQAQLETANARLHALNAELATQGRLHEQENVRARRDIDLVQDVLSKDIPGSLEALRAALAAPDEHTEARLQREIGRIAAVVGALGEIGREPPLQRGHTDIAALANDVVRELRGRARYARVRYEVDAGLRAQADRQEIAALLRHLVKRASTACLGEPEPLVHVGSGALEGQAVYFVRDNGPGMDDAQREKMFRPFEGGDLENTVDIGIVSARRIAERHGGELFVESAPGKGTTFFFTLSAG